MGKSMVSEFPVQIFPTQKNHLKSSTGLAQEADAATQVTKTCVTPDRNFGAGIGMGPWVLDGCGP